jgi:uncharacterized protein (TIGR00251 family)
MESEPPSIPGPWAGLRLNDRSGGVRLDVHVRPRSSRSAILGVRDGALDVALTSPPADGAANSELIRLLARALGVRAADVTIVVGPSSRTKVVAINGIGADEARTRFRKGKR